MKLSFLSPNSIAIVGASNKPEKRGFQALKQLLADGFAVDSIFPINPGAESILGVKCYPALTAVPASIDLVLICTPAHSLAQIIADCGRKGIAGAIVLAAGMGETGSEAGKLLERNMLQAAQQYGVRLVGPNTNGIFNLSKRLNIVGVPQARAGKIGILSQSGNVMLGLVAEAAGQDNIGFSSYIGVGNQSDIKLSEYLEYFGSDTNTEVVVAYIEGFSPGDGRRFLQVARELIASKPLLVYKAGRTAAGQVSANSHTGSLAGSYQLSRDLLRQSGVNVARNLDELLALAQTLSQAPLPAGDRVAILCDSGGHSTIAADVLTESGLHLAQLSTQSLTALRARLGAAAALNNPVDVAGATDEDTSAFADCVDILLADPGVDLLIIVGLIGGYSIRFSPDLSTNELKTSKRIVELLAQHRKPLLIQAVYQRQDPEALQVLRASGVPIFASVELVVSCARELVGYSQARQRVRAVSETAELVAETRVDIGAKIIESARAQGRVALLEPEARDLLSANGLPMPRHQFVSAVDQLEHLPAGLAEVPLAMKLVSADIVHKSEAGGVKLNIRGQQQLRQAYQQIIASAEQYRAGASITGVMLTPMLQPGVELIVGYSQDSSFGPVLMFGLGGILVEIMRDVAFRSLPLDLAEAEAMIGQIQAQAIIDGARGGQALNRRALAQLLLKLGQVALQYPQIASIDLNPIIAQGDSYAIADARILLTTASGA